MTRINIKPDCGNSPKKAFLRDWNIAFAEGNLELLKNSVSEDIEWNIYGDQKIVGKEAFAKAIHEMANYKADAMTIHHIITHGKEAAVNGEMVMQDSGKTYAFCDVYEFRSAGSTEIRRMHSYVLQDVQLE